MKIITAIIVLMLFLSKADAASLPVKTWTGNTKSPLVFYISGDGGLNSFTTGLCSSINQLGYEVTALNAKSYFWDKKTPDQAASDISAFIAQTIKGRANQQVVLIGYSFGADVGSFIYNRCTAAVRQHIQSCILLAPSTSTDFEIHLSDMWGKPKDRGMDVVAEMNKLGNLRTTVITAEDDVSFPIQSVKLKNFNGLKLTGGHHFGGETTSLAKTAQKYF